MSEEASHRSRRVMVVDDDEVNLVLAEALLEMFGVEPVAISSPHRAYTVFQQDRFDLILMDVHMPGMSGLELTDQIRALEHQSGRPRTSIVALTASAMPHELNQCLEHDMDGALSKPIDFEALKATLERWSSPGR